MAIEFKRHDYQTRDSCILVKNARISLEGCEFLETEDVNGHHRGVVLKLPEEKVDRMKEIEGEDESIEEYEHYEYDPITGTNLNNPGELRINIETQDLFTHPSESYLIIEGRLTKTDGTAYANDDNVTLTNNALMYLFSNIKYQLSGQEIESLFHPGQASAAAAAGNAGFSVRQSYITKSPDPKGTFSFRVPLKHIFGFCEDYDKIVYGMKQTLTLVRKTDNDAIFRNANVDDGKITFEKVSWFMPHVLPADAEKFQLYKTLDSNELLPVMYRIRQCDYISIPQSTSFTWRLSVKSAPERPRYIIVGFQTDKDGDQEQNPSIFDNVNVRNIFVMLNSARYPAVDYNLSFPKQQFSRANGDVAAFRSKFYNMDELVSNPNITPPITRHFSHCLCSTSASRVSD
ncbi:uncharacterized protein LOC132564147 [Ylistrum balloti]|uniref:uncharacterized protein LOC132564147 n=1 Tax=Ylistrum balloti TaxID=509963 RepID=UPI0029058ABF|nr:uncharacterized protein LOC132564147 [Ylistrum balloti]